MYATVFACAAAMVWLVLRYDKHGKKPLRMVALAMMLGAGLMSAAGAAENVVLPRLHLRPDQFAVKSAVVSSIEESSKLIMIGFIAVGFRRHFSDTLDGLLFGTLGGLGMALDESLMYLGLSAATPQTLGAEIVRLFAHSMMGGVLGFAVGVFLFTPGRRRPLLSLACVAVVLLVHFSWDYVAYQPRTEPAFRGFLMLLMLALSLLWRAMVAHAQDQINEQRRPPSEIEPTGSIADRRASLRLS